MDLNFSHFLNSRIDKLGQTLLRTDSDYALAVEKSKALLENIEPIMDSPTDITISTGDCMDFKEFIENEYIAASVMQRELYKAGYRDCVKLLKTLGILI